MSAEDFVFTAVVLFPGFCILAIIGLCFIFSVLIYVLARLHCIPDWLGRFLNWFLGDSESPGFNGWNMRRE